MKRFSQYEISKRISSDIYHRISISLPFCQCYPRVLSCKIEYCREADSVQNDNDTDYNTKVVSVEKDSSFVYIKCSNPDCTNGYFDLSSIISMMVNQQKTYNEGKLICQGFQDAERIGNFHCLCELDYKIYIEYN